MAGPAPCRLQTAFLRMKLFTIYLLLIHLKLQQPSKRRTFNFLCIKDDGRSYILEAFKLFQAASQSNLEISPSSHDDNRSTDRNAQLLAPIRKRERREAFRFPLLAEEVNDSSKRHLVIFAAPTAILREKVDESEAGNHELDHNLVGGYGGCILPNSLRK